MRSLFSQLDGLRGRNLYAFLYYVFCTCSRRSVSPWNSLGKVRYSNLRPFHTGHFLWGEIMCFEFNHFGRDGTRF